MFDDLSDDELKQILEFLKNQINKAEEEAREVKQNNSSIVQQKKSPTVNDLKTLNKKKTPELTQVINQVLSGRSRNSPFLATTYDGIRDRINTRLEELFPVNISEPYKVMLDRVNMRNEISDLIMLDPRIQDRLDSLNINIPKEEMNRLGMVEKNPRRRIVGENPFDIDEFKGRVEAGIDDTAYSSYERTVKKQIKNEIRA